MVLNVTTVVSPSLPGCDSTILANGHLQGGRRGGGDLFSFDDLVLI